MSPIPNPRVIFNSIPEGFPEPGKTTVYDKSETIDLDTVSITDGGLLVKALYLSVDPYMRGRMREPEIESYSPPFFVGQPLDGYGVGVVVKSKNPQFKEGDHVYGILKHQVYIIYEDKGDLIVLDNKENLPWSYYVGVCGMPGKTAFDAWHEYSGAKKGETAFVTAGGGPVGSFVIQLAKLDGCKVIASAGSEEKVQFMRSLGADVAFNYKTTNTLEVLQREGGIDIFWDNVGGETLDAALEAAKVNARFIECGWISGYNNGGTPVTKGLNIFAKSISLFGFVIFRIQDKYEERFYREVPKLVAEGKLKYKEQVYEGLGSVGEAILEVQKGMNKAKAVVKVADDSTKRRGSLGKLGEALTTLWEEREDWEGLEIEVEMEREGLDGLMVALEAEKDSAFGEFQGGEKELEASQKTLEQEQDELQAVQAQLEEELKELKGEGEQLRVERQGVGERWEEAKAERDELRST